MNNILKTWTCLLRDILLCSILPVSRNLYFNNPGHTGIYGIVVHLYNIVTLLLVRSLSCCLHIFYSILNRDDICKFEESCLKHCVDTTAKTDFLTNLDTVYCVKLNAMLRYVLLSLTRETLWKLIYIPRTVKKEGTAILYILNHIILMYIWRIVTGNKICFIDKIGRVNLLITETKVRNSYTAWFLWIIVKISLCIFICMITDNLNRVLISTDSTVCTKSPELTGSSSCRSCSRVLCDIERKVSYIILDTDSKSWLFCILVSCNNLCRSCILRTKTITACGNKAGLKLSSAKWSHNIKVKRLTKRTRLFCTVKYDDVLNSLRKSSNKMLSWEWSVEANLNNTNLVSVSIHIINSLIYSFANWTHSYNYSVCILCSIVIEKLVVSANLSINLIHIILYNFRHNIIETVRSFSCLEEDIRVLSCTTL